MTRQLAPFSSINDARNFYDYNYYFLELKLLLGFRSTNTRKTNSLCHAITKDPIYKPKLINTKLIVKSPNHITHITYLEKVAAKTTLLKLDAPNNNLNKSSDI